MIRYLKNGRSADDAASDDAKVRTTVEGMLADIGSRGDVAVREYSEKLDKWSPASFRLTKAEIEECYRQLPQQALPSHVVVPGLMDGLTNLNRLVTQTLERGRRPAMKSRLKEAGRKLR